jgi:Holliday junction resolvase RusA-like endonuclease
MDAMNRSHCAEWFWPSAKVRAVFYFRDHRKRDRDNALSSLKAHFDGLADAGLISNDSGLTHMPVVMNVDKSNPRVVLLIEKEETQ